MVPQDVLSRLIFCGGVVQLLIPIASALVPLRLHWREAFAPLPRLHRQLYWVYGGYVLLGIVALGLIALGNSQELASGSRLARSVCAYICAFWGIRLALQTVLDAREHLTLWWLRAGYHLLTVLFTFLTFVFGLATIGPAR